MIQPNHQQMYDRYQSAIIEIEHIDRTYTGKVKDLPPDVKRKRKNAYERAYRYSRLLKDPKTSMFHVRYEYQKLLSKDHLTPVEIYRLFDLRRRVEGWSKTYIAKKKGLPVTSYSQMERTKSLIHHMEHAEGWANAFGYTLQPAPFDV